MTGPYRMTGPNPDEDIPDPQPGPEVEPVADPVPPPGEEQIEGEDTEADDE